MKCYNVRRRLEKMALGETDGLLDRQLHEHLLSCPGCRAEYQAMKEAVETPEQVPRVETVSHFNPAWRQRIRQEALKKNATKSRFSFLKANTLIPALGVLAVVLVFAAYHNLNRITPEPDLKGETYQLRILKPGPNLRQVRRIISNFRSYHKDGAVSDTDQNSGSAFFSGLSKREMEKLKAELEKAQAVVEVGIEGN